MFLNAAPNFLHYDELVLGGMVRWRDDLHVCRPYHPLPRSVPHQYVANYPGVGDRGVEASADVWEAVHYLDLSCLFSRFSPALVRKTCHHLHIRTPGETVIDTLANFRYVVSKSEKFYDNDFQIVFFL